MTQQPSIGRVVHYTRADLLVEPAIITRVHVPVPGDGDPVVSLLLFGVYVTERLHNVLLSESPAGTEEAREKWSWPVFVPPK